MNPTEYFIARPTAALALALLLMLAGAGAYLGLPWRGQDQGAAAVTVEIDWPGADAADARARIAAPAQRLLTGIEGVRAIDGESRPGAVTMKLWLRPGQAPAPARTAVEARLRGLALPDGAQAPRVGVDLNEQAVLIAFSGESLDERTIAQIAATAVPAFATIASVASVRNAGGGEAVVAVDIDAKRAGALGVTIDDIERALAQADGIFRGGALGGALGGQAPVTVQIGAPIRSLAQLGEIAVGRVGDRPIRLADVAAIDWRLDRASIARFDGKPALALAIARHPSSDGLEFSADVAAMLARIATALPPGIAAAIVHDPHRQAARVLETDLTLLAAAIGACVLAIWLALGWWRAGIVPLLAASLTVAAMAVLSWALGLAVTPVTLLAMVAAMALVGDDAMAVVEDVDRQLREGKPPMLAPLFAARHLARPTLATALAIAALYAPIAFAGPGAGGGLWVRDFALALGLTALVSGLVSLTLAPALCARLLRYRVRPPTLGRIVERLTRAITVGYDRGMVGLMARRRWVMLLVLAAMGGTAYMAAVRLGEAPGAGAGMIEVRAQAPASADRAYLLHFAGKIDQAMQGIAAIDHRLSLIDSEGRLRVLATVKDASRAQAAQATAALQAKLDLLVGVSAYAIEGDGRQDPPLQLVLVGNDDGASLIAAGEKLLATANQGGQFAYVLAEPFTFRPIKRLNIDRAKAAALDIAPDTVGRTLSLLLSGARLGAVSGDGISLPIVLRAAPGGGNAQALLAGAYIRGQGGKLVPLLELVDARDDTQLTYFLQRDGQAALRILAAPRPGLALADAGNELARLAALAAPADTVISWDGGLIQSGRLSLALLVAIALLAAYLVMAATVESFRDAMAIVIAAMPALFVAAAAMAAELIPFNAYGVIGALTGFALCLRQGALLNKVSIDLRIRERHDKVQAVGLAAVSRLRPNLIGALTMGLALLPMVLLDGPGDGLRAGMALTLLIAVAGGTFLAIFIAPAVFSIVGAAHGAPRPAEPARPASAGPRVVAVSAPQEGAASEGPRPLRPVMPQPKPMAKPMPAARRRKSGGASEAEDTAASEPPIKPEG